MKNAKSFLASDSQRFLDVSSRVLADSMGDKKKVQAGYQYGFIAVGLVSYGEPAHNCGTVFF